MALKPKISLSIPGTCCDKIKICEETNIYSTANTGGWGAPNEETSDVASAYVYVYDSAGTNLLETYIIKDGVTDLYPSVTPPAFIAFNGATWGQGDGIYKVVYQVTNTALPTPAVYTNDDQYILTMCSLENCMEKIVGKLVTECDEDKLEEYKNILDQLEILKYGIKTAFACNNFTRATTLLTNANTICSTFSGCDCDCDCGC